MPRFQLFAARDGETINDVVVLPDYDAAEVWAAGRMVDCFDLDNLKNATYTEVVAETDGVELYTIHTDPMDEFVVDWLAAQLHAVGAIGQHLEDRFPKQFRSCRGGILDLLLAVRDELHR